MLKIIFGGVKGFIQPLMNKMYCLNLLYMSGQVLEVMHKLASCISCVLWLKSPPNRETGLLFGDLLVCA